MSTCSGDTTVGGFRPRTVTQFARPVQVESATGGLCGAALPDGRGILVWPNGTNVWFAITDTPRQWLINDVVTAGQISTALSVGSGNLLRRTSVWMHDGGLFITVLWREPQTSPTYIARLDIYKANSATNPTSWALWSTVKSVTYNGDFTMVERSLVAGIPYRMASGRLVLCGTSWNDPATAPQTRAGVWSSTDGGQTWTQHVHIGYGTGQFFTQFVSGQVGCDPATGTLMWFAGTDQFARRFAWHSPNGTGWTQSAELATEFAVGQGIMLYPFNNGAHGVLFHGDNIHIPSGNPWDQSTWGPVRGRWFPVGEGGNHDARSDTVKAIIAPGGVYAFWLDRVSFMPAGGWTVGRIGF